MTTDTKPTNPKDVIGSTKLAMSSVPDSLVAYAALSFTEGALKYGRYNWRIAGVRASIYHDALRRHIAKWWNGEWSDPDTQVPHLASALACIGIILDANLAGKLTDDRPPVNLEIGDFIGEADRVVAHLKKIFAEHNPHQYTIDDSSSLDTATGFKATLSGTCGGHLVVDDPGSDDRPATLIHFDETQRFPDKTKVRIVGCHAPRRGATGMVLEFKKGGSSPDYPYLVRLESDYAVMWFAWHELEEIV